MYNEAEWIRLLFLLSDIQQWLTDMQKELFMQEQTVNKKNLFRKSYHLTATAFAHIIERHYYKIPRHPQSSKFKISIADILHWIKEGFNYPSRPLPNSALNIRQFNTGVMIGNDRSGHPTSTLTILTESCGLIKTAFPGLCYQLGYAE